MGSFVSLLSVLKEQSATKINAACIIFPDDRLRSEKFVLAYFKGNYSPQAIVMTRINQIYHKLRHLLWPSTEHKCVFKFFAIDCCDYQQQEMADGLL